VHKKKLKMGFFFAPLQSSFQDFLGGTHTFFEDFDIKLHEIEEANKKFNDNRSTFLV